MTQISFQFEQLLTFTFCKLCHFISKGHKFKMTKKRKRKGNTLAHIPTNVVILEYCVHAHNAMFIL